MKFRFARILMNQADSSPGGGAAPPSPQAQGASSAAAAPPAIDATSIAAEVTKQVNDSVFAALRKAGVLGGDKSQGKGAPATGEAAASSAPAPAAQGLTLEDVQKMVHRESAFARAIGAAGLTPDQEGIVQTLYATQKPDDPGAFVAATVKALGIQRADNKSQPPAPNNQRPVSDAGGPAPPATPGGAPSLLKMSEADRADWCRQNGVVAFRQQLQRELKGQPVKVRDR